MLQRSTVYYHPFTPCSPPFRHVDAFTQAYTFVLKIYRLPNMLANRMFLNLRSFQDHTNGLSTNTAPLPEPIFAHSRSNRFLGNIGEPLDYDHWDNDLDSIVEVDGGSADNETHNPVQDPMTTSHVPVVSYISLLSA